MNGQIVREEDIQTSPPTWQHPVLPGNAVQGSLLFTLNSFINPPEDMSNFKWIPMEYIIGTADIKLEYNDELNEHSIYKAKGHLNNDNSWVKEWELVGKFYGLTPETEEALRSIKYVDFIYDTSIANTLIVYGVRKNGVQDILCNISFISAQVFNEAVTNINAAINNEITRATNRENEIQVKAGQATNITQVVDGRQVNVLVDNDSIVINNNNLKANVIDDGLGSSQTKTWSIDQIKQYAGANGFQYKGEVYAYADLPLSASMGSAYYVINEADIFVYLGSLGWKPFTEIYDAYNVGAINLTKSTNGLYATLRYDSIDFIIDNLNNLKSQIIDDTLGAADTNANRKTYSIVKIMQLLSGAMKYAGQVATYADLPTNLTPAEAGWTYNVIDTGDNYAWNGTSWDNLSGEYIAGTGIQINGKVISATGISFNVGQGLEVHGTGTSAELRTKNGQGIIYDANNALKVKAGDGISVDSSGVHANVAGTTKIDTNNNIVVDFADGLKQDTNNKLAIKNGNGLNFDINGNLQILTNFNIKSTPLGTGDSKISLYSDGKIGIDTDAVILAGIMLKEVLMPNGTNQANNVSVPNLNKYDMLFLERIVYVTSTSTYISSGGQYLQKGSENLFVVCPAVTQLSLTPPQGLDFGLVKMTGVNYQNEIINAISLWTIATVGATSNWNAWKSTSGQSNGVRIYGMRAR